MHTSGSLWKGVRAFDIGDLVCDLIGGGCISVLWDIWHAYLTQFVVRCEGV